MKINVKELINLAAFEVEAGYAESSPAVILAAAKKFVGNIAGSTHAGERLYIALTDGPNTAHFISIPLKSNEDPRHWTIELPKLKRPLVSPIGAGDATSAGTLLHWSGEIATGDKHDRDVLTAFRWGLACGSASCLTAKNSRFDIADVEEIFGSMRVDEVPH